MTDTPTASRPAAPFPGVRTPVLTEKHVTCTMQYAEGFRNGLPRVTTLYDEDEYQAMRRFFGPAAKLRILDSDHPGCSVVGYVYVADNGNKWEVVADEGRVVLPTPAPYYRWSGNCPGNGDVHRALGDDARHCRTPAQVEEAIAEGLVFLGYTTWNYNPTGLALPLYGRAPVAPLNETLVWEDTGDGTGRVSIYTVQAEGDRARIEMNLRDLSFLLNLIAEGAFDIAKKTVAVSTSDAADALATAAYDLSEQTTGLIRLPPA